MTLAILDAIPEAPAPLVWAACVVGCVGFWRLVLGV